jgi:transposase-like protein
VGPKNQANAERENVRWGSEPGYCVVGGQKIPLQRPRVRDRRKKEVPLGSYELMQRASLMEESVWQKMMHGLTTRRYSEVIQELEHAYGIKKSTISEHFIAASRQRLDKLLARPLGDHALCAMQIDGTPFGDQQLITVLGLTVHGQKLVLGLRQGATENTTVVKQLLNDFRSAEWISKFRVFISWMEAKPCLPASVRRRVRRQSSNAVRFTRFATCSATSPKSTPGTSAKSCTPRTACVNTAMPDER